MASSSRRQESLQRESARKSHAFELSETRQILSNITAGQGLDLNVAGDLVAQTGSRNAQGELQADRMTRDGVVLGDSRQQLAPAATAAPCSATSRTGASFDQAFEAGVKSGRRAR